MSVLRELALPIYRWLTQSKRDVYARRFAASRQWPAAILYYHRVADHSSNPWTIDTKRFAQQLDYIESIAKFVSLDEIRNDQQSGTRDRLKVAITFDDGYQENMRSAIPELVRRRIACTYFVSTDYIEHHRPFPHDVQRGRPLKPNTREELRAMAEAGIQIGGHTCTHLDLGRDWPTERLRGELCDSRKRLQDWTGQAIHYFAFPYGLIANISQAAIDMVAEAGYQAFFSAFGGWNFPGGDDFHLKRFHGDPSTEALRNWLTFDPRRMKFPCDLPYRRPSRVEQAVSAQIPSAVSKSFQGLASTAMPAATMQVSL